MSARRRVGSQRHFDDDESDDDGDGVNLSQAILARKSAAARRRRGTAAATTSSAASNRARLADGHSDGDIDVDAGGDRSRNRSPPAVAVRPTAVSAALPFVTSGTSASTGKSKKDKKNKKGHRKKKLMIPANLVPNNSFSSEPSVEPKTSGVTGGSGGGGPSYSAADLAQLRAEMKTGPPPPSHGPGDPVDLVHIVDSGDEGGDDNAMDIGTAGDAILSQAHVEAARQERARLRALGHGQADQPPSSSRSRGPSSSDDFVPLSTSGRSGGRAAPQDRLLREGASDESADEETFGAHSGSRIAFGPQGGGGGGGGRDGGVVSKSNEDKDGRNAAMANELRANLHQAVSSNVDQLMRSAGAGQLGGQTDTAVDDQDEVMARWEASIIRGGGGVQLLEQQQREMQQQQQQQQHHHRQPVGLNGRHQQQHTLREPDTIMLAMETALRALRNRHEVTVQQATSAVAAMKRSDEERKYLAAREQSNVARVADLVEMREWCTDFLDFVEAKAPLIADLEQQRAAKAADRARQRVHRRADLARQSQSVIDQFFLSSSSATDVGGGSIANNGGLTGAQQLLALPADEEKVVTNSEQNQGSDPAPMITNDDGGDDDDGDNDNDGGGANGETVSDQVLVDAAGLAAVFADADPEYADIGHVCERLASFRDQRPFEYARAYVGECLPQLLAPLARHELLAKRWDPLWGTGSAEGGRIPLAQFTFVQRLQDYGIRGSAALASSAKRGDGDGANGNSANEDQFDLLTPMERKQRKTDIAAAVAADASLLQKVVERAVLPRITTAVINEWDPFSTQQTRQLVAALSEVQPYIDASGGGGVAVGKAQKKKKKQKKQKKQSKRGGGNDDGGDNDQEEDQEEEEEEDGGNGRGAQSPFVKCQAVEALQSGLVVAIQAACDGSGPISTLNQFLRPAAKLRSSPQLAGHGRHVEQVCQSRFQRTCRLLANMLRLRDWLPATTLSRLCVNLVIDPHLLPYVRNLQAQSPVEVLDCMEQFVRPWPRRWTRGLVTAPPELKPTYELLFLLQRTFVALLSRTPSPMVAALREANALSRLSGLFEKIAATSNVKELEHISNGQ